MDDLTTIELYILDRINHFSYEVIHLLSRPNLAQHDKQLINDYKCYVHAYRNILFCVRRMKEMKNNESDQDYDEQELKS